MSNFQLHLLNLHSASNVVQTLGVRVGSLINHKARKTLPITVRITGLLLNQKYNTEIYKKHGLFMGL